MSSLNMDTNSIEMPKAGVQIAVAEHVGKAVDEGLLYRAFGQQIYDLTEKWRAVHMIVANFSSVSFTAKDFWFDSGQFHAAQGNFDAGKMVYVSAASSDNYFASVSGSFQMKANDQDLHVGIAFSDPAMGAYKIHVGLQEQMMSINNLWSQMSNHNPQVLIHKGFKVETIIKQQYKIHSCDPLYIIMISDGTTNLEQVKVITKKYMARNPVQKSKSFTGSMVSQEFNTQLKQLEEKVKKLEMDLDDQKTQMEFDHENDKDRLNQKNKKEKQLKINEYEQKLLLLGKSKENELSQLNVHFENELKKVKEQVKNNVNIDLETKKQFELKNNEIMNLKARIRESDSVVEAQKSQLNQSVLCAEELSLNLQKNEENFEMEYNKMLRIVQEKDEEIKKLKQKQPNQEKQKSANNDNKEQIRELQELNQMLDMQLKEVKRQNSSSNLKIIALEKQIKTQQNSTLDVTITTLEEQIKTLRIEISSHEEKIKTLQIEVKDLRSKLASQKKEHLNEKQTMIQDFEKILAEQKDKNNSQEKEDFMKCQMCPIKDQQIEEQQEDISQKQEEIDELRRQLEEHRLQIEELKKQPAPSQFSMTMKQSSSVKQEMVPTIQKYKPVKGDEIDELFMPHLNKANLSFDVSRIAKGQYLFGTRKIQVKIVNGRLMIRVGGGYMNVEEFIEQYGRMEMLKLKTMSPKNRQTLGHVNQIDLAGELAEKINKRVSNTGFRTTRTKGSLGKTNSPRSARLNIEQQLLRSVKNSTQALERNNYLTVSSSKEVLTSPKENSVQSRKWTQRKLGKKSQTAKLDSERGGGTFNSARRS